MFVFAFVSTVSPSAQLLEQTARLQSLSETLDRLKVKAGFEPKHKTLQRKVIDSDATLFFRMKWQSMWCLRDLERRFHLTLLLSPAHHS